jgi:predicted nuclease of predicted toxin-antitoxin system
MIRLLIDENLSPRLVTSVADLFPDSRHVRDVGLAQADDFAVWAYGRDNGFTIATKDGDFHQMSFLFGAPPKVVWFRAGNCSTDRMNHLIRTHAAMIADFVTLADEAILIINF